MMDHLITTTTSLSTTRSQMFGQRAVRSEHLPLQQWLALQAISSEGVLESYNVAVKMHSLPNAFFPRQTFD